MDWLESLLGMPLFSWVLVSVLVLIFVYGWRLSVIYSTWSSQGIPGPKPIPFLGVNPFHIARIGSQQYVKEGLQKYGGTFGFYVGTRPVLITTDLDFITDVYIKKFSTFTNLSRLNFQPQKFAGITGLHDEEWKQMRMIVSPIFTALKLKQMVPLIQEGLKTLTSKIREASETGELVSAEELYGQFTMDTIFRSAFGIDAKVQTDPNDVYTKAINTLNHVNPIIVVLSMFLPVNMRLFELFPFAKLSALKVLQDTASKMIKMRREEGHPARADLLKLLMESENKDKKGDVISRLRNDQIGPQCLTFLGAGFDTTANTLTFASYALATHPDIQEKLAAEIRDHCPGDVCPDYDQITKLEYLDKVLKETLRQYPPIHLLARHCKEDCVVGGIRIPKDACVGLYVETIHNDPKIWPDPSKFDPERFGEEAVTSRHQYAHIPFSLGPRNCVGMRFALLEAKLALAEVLKRFKIVATPETKVKLNNKRKVTLSSDGGIWVKFVERET